ncbi:hypothetical protein CLAFUW4_02947 [Fulvia fulva]|uniref:Uncharacterized protein n=1 Tax=Passalora fulva TaxID=5499 RepID=A0A9Q8L9G7_PASFU|nr:uncharacterized protein CLAFUR5_02933 [Fulvia fulva]KAK4632012.1 hypothetical protein CLAFUR4_02940 [Fulvia fulva]KAK4633633.1 hypothetical protein CLAFUR0_02943 [Fulvia fulva]UJO13164.1 hypothetical protein CLAFUR5_02933 [Fulvia fulva]WPV10662.1 hypothetical protein CLAFUW4_02947 [Fulvia fulva]WPV26440.1 hypothetical protein CLAFUW7_02944 [Fulvia fulva]
MTSKAVNVPTDLKAKEKNVNAKLQLYGIYAAFANGKAPSNKQIDVAMNSALEWQGLKSPSGKLSNDGKQLVADLRDVIEKAKQLLLSKNEGNLLQDFIWQTQRIGAGEAQGVKAPIDKDTAKQHGNEALEGLRTLGQLTITNGQFRKLLSDAITLFRDIAGDAAQKAATKVNPDEEALSQIDRPAEDNTWHEAPDLSGANIKQQIRSQVPIGKKDLQDAAGDATQAGHPSGSRKPEDAAKLAAEEQRQGKQGTSLDPSSGAAAAAGTLKNRLDQNVDEEKKQQAREYRDRTREYFKGKMPQERREQIVYRLKKMIVEIQGHQDYQQAIDTLLRLAEQYGGHTKDVAAQSQGAVEGAHSQDSLQTAETDLRKLLERFANSTSFDDLFDSINQIYRDADRDPELKGFFKDTDRFIRKCLQEQGYVLQDESNQQWNKLYDEGQFLLRDRYRSHTDRIVDETKFLADQFDQDPQNQAFARSMEKLFKDLGNDADGKPEFKPHLVKDLTEVLLPAFFEHVRYVPIPRIEYSDHMVDAVVENLVIEGDNLAPNVAEFGSDNYWRWGRKGAQSKNKNKVMISVSGVQMDLRDVSYYIKKKEGFPSVTDKGVMDIFLGGSGLSFKIAMETADKSDSAHFFKINKVDVDIKNMNIKLKQSNHKLLFGLFKPLLLKVMRPVLLKVVEKQLRDNVSQLDAMLYRVKKEADRAAEEAKNNPDPENIQNIYQRYFNAFQQQMTKGQQKKEQLKEQAADKKVNVAVTQHDSMFKNIELPGGISTKATEYKNLAGKGDKWESPVFSIGSARESSNLPSVSEPQRKPHSTAQGGVRGGNQPNTVASGTSNGSAGGLAGGLVGSGAAPTGPNGSAGFSNQVNDAFKPTTDLGLNQPGSGAAAGDDGNTTLGRSNPVLQGNV